MTDHHTTRVAVVQAAPVAFDLEKTLAKTRTLAAEARAKGAELVLFPEAFVSAYPRDGRPTDQMRSMISALCTMRRCSWASASLSSTISLKS